MQYDIFISYKRRGTSSATAAYLYELLLRKGYNVFFDRKEMRSGDFNKQLYEHIENANDILILLEETSLNAIRSELKDFYKTDWFCMEIMHALSLEGKNIIPILLEGYKMPDQSELPSEMKGLAMKNALELDITEIEEFFDKYFIGKEYLKSKPKNLAISRQVKNQGATIGNFLFYTDSNSYDIFEFGEYITTITDDNDVVHPFRYPVSFAGEHRFQLKNNDTCEESTVVIRIDANCQEYVEVKWNWDFCPWTQLQKAENIKDIQDAEQLYRYGVMLFDGTSTRKPDYDLSMKCVMEAAGRENENAKTFLRSAYKKLIDRDVSYDEILNWIKEAAKIDKRNTLYEVGYLLETKKKYDQALNYYKEALNERDARAGIRLGWIYYNGEFDGIDSMKSTAFYYFSEAIKFGGSTNEFKDTCFFAGKMLYEGDGIEQNIPKALEYFILSGQPFNEFKMPDRVAIDLLYDYIRSYVDDNLRIFLVGGHLEVYKYLNDKMGQMADNGIIEAQKIFSSLGKYLTFEKSFMDTFRITLMRTEINLLFRRNCEKWKSNETDHKLDSIFSHSCMTEAHTLLQNNNFYTSFKAYAKLSDKGCLDAKYYFEAFVDTYEASIARKERKPHFMASFIEDSAQKKRNEVLPARENYLEIAQNYIDNYNRLINGSEHTNNDGKTSKNNFFHRIFHKN